MLACTSFRNPLSHLLKHSFIHFSNRRYQFVPNQDAFSVTFTPLQPSSSSSRRLISRRAGHAAPRWRRVEHGYSALVSGRRSATNTRSRQQKNSFFLPSMKRAASGSRPFLTPQNYIDKVQTKPLQQLRSLLRLVESAVQASVTLEPE